VRLRELAFGILVSALLTGVVRAEEASEGDGDSPADALEFGADIEIAYERRQNFDLDSAARDGVDLLDIEAVLEILFAPNDYFDIYLQPNLTREFELREQGEGEDRNTEFSLEEAFFTLRDPERGLSLEVGRTLFADGREWVYDEDLDAVRGSFRSPEAFLELSASRQALVDVDLLNPDNVEPITNHVAYGGFEPIEDVTLGAYGILRDHRDDDGFRPLFLGLFSHGTIEDRLTYWLDAAHVRGREEDTKLRGYGVDLLGSYEFDAPLSPRLILGYAFGSGDPDPDDDRDRAFRQTGLQGNEAELGGLTLFKYLGEAFDPELSNMSIFTAGLGAWPTEEFSVDLVYHYYLQDEASDELRDSALEAEPTGRSRDLGHEIDLVVGLEALEDFEVRGFLGYFMPGNAFGPGADDALFARIELEYEF
jgi:alginate production protein